MKRACSQNTNKDENLTSDFHPTIKHQNYLQMKAKVFMFIILISLSGVLVAQPADMAQKRAFRGPRGEMQMKNGQRAPGNGLNLTDAQKEAFKQRMMATHKLIQPIHNEIGEAEAHQKTLVSAEKPDLNAINKNIEKIGALKIEMAKIQAKQRLDMRAQLTDEQKLKFDLFQGKMKQGRGAKGVKHGQRMQQG